jgi:hypothetical protein
MNSYFSRNKVGLRLKDTAGGSLDNGILSSIDIFGCSFEFSTQYGAVTDADSGVGQPYDVAFYGCYFLANNSYGLFCPNGCQCLSHNQFENNQAGGSGPAAKIANFGFIEVCNAGGSANTQTVFVDSYVGGALTMIGCVGPNNALLTATKGGTSAKVTTIACQGTRTYNGGFLTSQIFEFADS